MIQDPTSPGPVPQPDGNPFAPPRTQVADIPESTTGLRLASRRRRLAAAMVDVVILLSVVGLVAALTPWNAFAHAPVDPWAFAPASALSGFLTFLVLNGYLLATRGQTLGKVLLGTRIVRTDGTPASAGQVLGLRYGVFALPNLLPAVGQVVGLVNALFIFHPSRRCLHDRVAGTVVVRT